MPTSTRAQRKAAEAARKRRDNEVVGKAYLNIRSDGASRTDDDPDGHAWITMTTYENPLPQEIQGEVPAQTAALMEHYGEASVGFYCAESKWALDKDAPGKVVEPDNATNPTARKGFDVTLKQFRKLYQYINSHRTHKYNAKSYTGTTFATHALKHAGLAVDKRDHIGEAYKDMYEEAKSHARRRNPTPCAVSLKKLSAGQAHNKRGADKEGARGNARLAGVDGFAMHEFNALDTLVVTHKNRPFNAAEDTKFVLQVFRNTKSRSKESTLASVDNALAFQLIDQNRYNAIKSVLDLGSLVSKPKELGDAVGPLYLRALREACGDNAAAFDAMMQSEKLIGPKIPDLVRYLIKYAMFHTDAAGVAEAVTKVRSDCRNIAPALDTIAKDTVSPAIRACKDYTRENLERFRALLDMNGCHWSAEPADVFPFVHKYFMSRIDAHTLTNEDVADAQAFQAAFPMPRLAAHLGEYREAAKACADHRFYAKLYGRNNAFVDTMAKAQIQAPVQQANGFEVIEDENEVVADVYVNVDTDTVSRSNMGIGELFRGEVGHTWLTVTQRAQYLPADLERYLDHSPFGGTTINLMRSTGSTAIGFWPLQFDIEYEKKNASNEKDIAKAEARGDEEKLQELRENRLNLHREEILSNARKDIRQKRGFSTGGGDAGDDRTACGYHPFKDVRGKVEEPDDAHTPKARKKFSLTRFQFKQIFDYINANRGHAYNLRTYNCTTFAAEAVRAAGYQIGGTTAGIQLPTAMYRHLYKEAKAAQEAMPKQNPQQTDQEYEAQAHPDIQFLKLGADEAHRKVSEDKMGGGENVRIKGVEQFDMVTKYVSAAEGFLRAAEIAEDPEDRQYFVDEFKDQLMMDKKTMSDIQIAALLSRAQESGILTDQEVADFQLIVQEPKYRNNSFPQNMKVQFNGLNVMRYFAKAKKFLKDSNHSTFYENMNMAIESLLDKHYGLGLFYPPEDCKVFMDTFKEVQENAHKLLLKSYEKKDPTPELAAEALFMCSVSDLSTYDVRDKILEKVFATNGEILEFLYSLYRNQWFQSEDAKDILLGTIQSVFGNATPAEHHMDLLEGCHNAGYLTDEMYQGLVDFHNEMMQMEQEQA